MSSIYRCPSTCYWWKCKQPTTHARRSPSLAGSTWVWRRFKQNVPPRLRSCEGHFKTRMLSVRIWTVTVQIGTADEEVKSSRLVQVQLPQARLQAQLQARPLVLLLAPPSLGLPASCLRARTPASRSAPRLSRRPLSVVLPKQARSHSEEHRLEHQ